MNLEAVKKKEAEELVKREKWASRKPIKYGLFLTMIALFFVSGIDEVCTSIGTQLQSSVVAEFFVNRGIRFNEGIAMYATVTSLTGMMYMLTPFYKALADKFGRKLFLALNTAGMGIGMILCWTSTNAVMYFIGFMICQFFIQHDMQIVFLYEVAPKDKRATIYGLIKGLSTFGVVLVPYLRTMLMGNDPTKWRYVYMVPGILAVSIAVLVFIVTRESKDFLDKRIEYLKMPFEVRHPQKIKDKKLSNETKERKVGVFHGLKQLVRNKQLLWPAIAVMLFMLASRSIAGYAEAIMTGYGMSTENVSKALYMYPFVYGFLQIGAGFFGDQFGRKKVVAIGGTVALVGFLGFNFVALYGINPYLVGTLYGVYIGCWWLNIDYANMMIVENAPTYNRGSIAGAIGFATMIGGMVGMVIPIIAPLLFDKVGFGYMVGSAPFVLIGILIIIFKCKETKGVDLSTVEYENE